jgi:Peptidase family M48
MTLSMSCEPVCVTAPTSPRRSSLLRSMTNRSDNRSAVAQSRKNALLGVLLIALCAGSPAWCEDIAQVLQRSQQARLDTLPEVAPETPGAAALRDSFERLQHSLPAAGQAQLRVVATGALTETLRGNVVVMNIALSEPPEICRLFLIAHELGHVTLGHWGQRIALYRQFIPGEVVQQQTDAIAPQLGREASMQSHQQEYDADAFAMRTLLDMGYSRDELLEMFFRLGQHTATATHPSSGKRLAQVRMIDDERRMANAPQHGGPEAGFTESANYSGVR